MSLFSPASPARIRPLGSAGRAMKRVVERYSAGPRTPPTAYWGRSRTNEARFANCWIVEGRTCVRTTTAKRIRSTLANFSHGGGPEAGARRAIIWFPCLKPISIWERQTGCPFFSVEAERRSSKLFVSRAHVVAAAEDSGASARDLGQSAM